jgi:acetyl esterase
VNDQDRSWASALGLSADSETARDNTVDELVRFHTRPPTPAGCIFEANVVYGMAGRPPRPLHLDAYRHQDGGATLRPGVLFVHGGSWAEGHRYAHIRRACLLAAEGFVTATMSYRLSGEARWPAQIVDVKCALRFMRAESRWLGLDPNRLAIAGSSAGGHLAAMAALTPGRFGGDGGPATQHASHSDEVSAAVLWYPVIDLNASKALRDPVFALIGSRRRRRLAAASPLGHVLAGAPPVLSMIGERDDLVPMSSAVHFHEELTRAGVRNQLQVYPDAGHAFDFDPVPWNDSYAHCRNFLSDVLGPLS